jgi:hypothetical protein
MFLLSTKMAIERRDVMVGSAIFLLKMVAERKEWLKIRSEREDRRLRVFENGVLRRIFRPKRDEVTGEMEEVAQ